MSTRLIDYFNRRPRLGTLSTASKSGKVNAATFNSIQMIDEKRVIMGLGKNRSFKNLQENPNAVFLIMDPGKTLSDWKGVRVYLRMTDCQTAGDKLETIRSQITRMAGEGAAKMIHAAVSFEVQEIRPLADFGQGWEQSI
ncbi:MAG: pyridoxamine 5'-phosphate oxidase family protein [Proteobacteria bacterium]|nr:pyridoxamine 5'-phosphate oxidase family protein [Pseudomonadota bacterium]